MIEPATTIATRTQRPAQYRPRGDFSLWLTAGSAFFRPVNRSGSVGRTDPTLVVSSSNLFQLERTCFDSTFEVPLASQSLFLSFCEERNIDRHQHPTNQPAPLRPPVFSFIWPSRARIVNVSLYTWRHPRHHRHKYLHRFASSFAVSRGDRSQLFTMASEVAHPEPVKNTLAHNDAPPLIING